MPHLRKHSNHTSHMPCTTVSFWTWRSTLTENHHSSALEQVRSKQLHLDDVSLLPPAYWVLCSSSDSRFIILFLTPHNVAQPGAEATEQLFLKKYQSWHLFSLWHSLTLGIEESDLQHTGKDDQLFAPREQGTSWVRWRNCGALSGCVNYFRCAATIIRRRKKIERRPLMLCPKKLIQWARGILLTLDRTLMISW